MITHKDFDNIINLINSLSDEDFDSLTLFLISKSPNKTEIHDLKNYLSEKMLNNNK